MPKTTPPEFIDIHSHLNFKDYMSDREAAILRMKAAKTWTITVGTDFPSSQRAIELARENLEIFACIGMHPADNSTEIFDEKKYAALLDEPKVVAVGECGLDYARLGGDPSSVSSAKKKQREIFEKQIKLAVDHNKPLMLHCRDAYDDVLEILSSHQKTHGEKVRGNVHFFSGTLEQAKKFLDIGFTLSFTGVITFARSYDEVIRFAPQGMIMSETDAPYVAPLPYRGRRNEPSYVSEVVSAIAKIREEPLEEVKKALVSTAFRVFGLPTA